MRGRRGASASSSSSSSVSQKQTRMPLRKQAIKDACADHQIVENTQDDGDDNEEVSSSLLSPLNVREKRRKERENKSQPKEMTEDEMMDLALRLSEQEASISTRRRQEEEDQAVMKAIQESMMSQTQACPPSQSLLADTRASLAICPRRKFFFSNGKSSSAVGRRDPEDGCSQDLDPDPSLDPDLDPAGTGRGDESSRCKKRKRKDGSPPDASRPSRPSSCSSEPPLDSLQCSDPTQIDDCQLRKSPVFPQSGCRAEVHVPRLSQDLLQTCRTSGFVCCSQDSWNLTAQPRSPTFPKSPKRPRKLSLSNSGASPKSPVLSETDGGDDGDTQLSPEYLRSPVFGRNTQREKSPSAFLAQTCNSGITFSSQESLTSSVRSTSCRSKSPVFPGRPDPPAERSAACRSPVFSETNGGRSAESRTQDGTPRRRDESDEEPRQTSKDSDETELTSDMTLHWSDQDDTPVGSPSPVFPKEGAVRQAAPLNHARSRQQSEAASGAAASPGEPAGGSTVHYYWGVPFCPRGLDPDHYTQVIQAQMEVYEKSLKRAQRRLLRKAEWGDAVLPQPEKSPSPESPAASPPQTFPQRRGLRLRGKKLCDSADAPASQEEEEEEEEDHHRGEEENKEEKETEGGEEEQADDCEVCPETQLSDLDVATTSDPDAQLRAQCPESPEVEMILQVEPPAVEELQEQEDAPGGRKTAANSSDAGGRHVTDEEDPDMEEIPNPGPQRSMSPELEPAVLPETRVDCPICQGSFPVTEIEIHAAYCDGEVAAAQASPKLRRKRTRRAEATSEEANESSNTDRNQEKCFICQRAIPLRDFSRHTELCIQRQAARTSTKENLLSALEKTESRDSEAGPSGSRFEPGDVIDLRDEEEEEEEEDSASAIRISNSPIRSFTSISEATGCLIDFKKQHRTKKPSQRRRR